MLTRRRFLRDLGTGLLVAAAAPVLIEPEPARKQWFMRLGAPAPVPRGLVVMESAPPAMHDGDLWFDGEGLNVYAGGRAHRIGVNRGDDAAELQARVHERISAYLYKPPSLTVDADGTALTPAMLKQHLRHEADRMGVVVPFNLKVTFTL